jgi:two-component system, OmpR family, copper resistance phosphate regulon response regulator CusR
MPMARICRLLYNTQMPGHFGSVPPIAQLLLVEDEAQLAANLKRGLSEAGYIVDSARTAETARELIAKNQYRLVLLDLRLPGQDGLEFLRDMRQAGLATPVLILTARDSSSDKVTGLDSGADDYLTKPFAFEELLARVRALLRRPLTATLLKQGDIAVDIAKRRAWRGRRELALSPKELMTLECLVRHAGVAVTRDTIGETVWGPEYNAASNIVEVFINRLRQKLDHINQPSLIITVRGSGYLLRIERD